MRDALKEVIFSLMDRSTPEVIRKEYSESIADALLDLLKKDKLVLKEVLRKRAFEIRGEKFISLSDSCLAVDKVGLINWNGEEE